MATTSLRSRVKFLLFPRSWYFDFKDNNSIFVRHVIVSESHSVNHVRMTLIFIIILWVIFS